MIKTIACAAALLLCTDTWAATCTWTGAGANASWSTAANWNNCGGVHALPVNGDSLVFPDGAMRLTNSNDRVSLQVISITFGGLNYDIGGNAISLANGITTNTPVGGLGDLGPRFRPDITLTSGQSFFCQAGKFLYLDGTVSAGSNALVIDGSCNTALRGSLTGVGGAGSGSLQKYGTGSLYVTKGPHTYSGFNLLNGGTTYVGTDSGLGASGPDAYTSVGSGAALSLYQNVSVAETVYLDNATLENFLGDNTLEKYLWADTGSTIDVVYADDTLTLNGLTTASDPTPLMTKAGPGRLVLNENTYTPFNVTAGTIEVNGLATESYNLVGGSTLSGDGSIGGSIVLAPGTKLAPGTRGKPGTLVGSVVSWSATAEMRMRLGVLSDRLTLSGALAASGGGVHEFTFLDGNTPPKVGTTYTLVDYGVQSGLDAAALNSTYAYIGTGSGDSLTGTFDVGATKLTFTVSAVTSDLLFRDSYDP